MRTKIRLGWLNLPHLPILPPAVTAKLPKERPRALSPESFRSSVHFGPHEDNIFTSHIIIRRRTVVVLETSAGFEPIPRGFAAGLTIGRRLVNRR